MTTWVHRPISHLSTSQQQQQQRLYTLDLLRGLTIVSMVIFHGCYDLSVIQGKFLPFFQPPYQDICRASISWTFLLIAGISCALSRNNLYRFLRYGALSLAIFVATSLAAIDTPINFGIIFCMAASTFIAWIVEQSMLSKQGQLLQLVLCLVLFVIFLPVNSGFLGGGVLKVALPAALYQYDWLSWLGFPGPHFFSGDYYPLLPYSLLYMAGAHLGWFWKQRGFPVWLSSLRISGLEWVGRHPLEIYILHQPLLLLVLQLWPC